MPRPLPERREVSIGVQNFHFSENGNADGGGGGGACSPSLFFSRSMLYGTKAVAARAEEMKRGEFDKITEFRELTKEKKEEKRIRQQRRGPQFQRRRLAPLPSLRPNFPLVYARTDGLAQTHAYGTTQTHMGNDRTGREGYNGKEGGFLTDSPRERRVERKIGKRDA